MTSSQHAAYIDLEHACFGMILNVNEHRAPTLGDINRIVLAMARLTEAHKRAHMPIAQIEAENAEQQRDHDEDCADAFR